MPAVKPDLLFSAELYGRSGKETGADNGCPYEVVALLAFKAT